MIRVIIADIYPIVRAGIRSELVRHTDIKVLSEASDVHTTLQTIYNHGQPVDVVVLGTELPGMSCIELLELILTIPQPPYVLLVSANRTEDWIVQLLAAGATGYVLKDEEPAILPLAVRAVAQGNMWVSPTVVSAVINRTIKYAPPSPARILSAREIEVLEELAAGKANYEIGEALNISERTVRFHLRNIYDKLQLRRSEAIAWWLQQKHLFVATNASSR